MQVKESVDPDQTKEQSDQSTQSAIPSQVVWNKDSQIGCTGTFP